MPRASTIKQANIQSENERRWFSIVQHLARETSFGKIELSLTVKGGEVVNISEAKTFKNFNMWC